MFADNLLSALHVWLAPVGSQWVSSVKGSSSGAHPRIPDPPIQIHRGLAPYQQHQVDWQGVVAGCHKKCSMTDGDNADKRLRGWPRCPLGRIIGLGWVHGQFSARVFAEADSVESVAPVGAFALLFAVGNIV